MCPWSLKKKVFSGPYFPAFGLNTERYYYYLSVFSPNARKYGPGKTPYLDTFYAMRNNGGAEMANPAIPFTLLKIFKRKPFMIKYRHKNLSVSQMLKNKPVKAPKRYVCLRYGIG